VTTHTRSGKVSGMLSDGGRRGNPTDEPWRVGVTGCQVRISPLEVDRLPREEARRSKVLNIAAGLCEAGPTDREIQEPSEADSATSLSHGPRSARYLPQRALRSTNPACASGWPLVAKFGGWATSISAARQPQMRREWCEGAPSGPDTDNVPASYCFSLGTTCRGSKGWDRANSDPRSIVG
jgi:hypothetical protein